MSNIIPDHLLCHLPAHLSEIKWDSKFELGVPHIDEQHEGLFRSVNRVNHILDEADLELDVERNRRACIESIKYLKGYTLQHFADEEAYQQEIGYPGFHQHRAQHRIFTSAVLRSEARMEAENYSADSVRAFLKMVMNWLEHHILEADQAIVPGETPEQKK